LIDPTRRLKEKRRAKERGIDVLRGKIQLWENSDEKSLIRKKREVEVRRGMGKGRVQRGITKRKG